MHRALVTVSAAVLALSIAGCTANPPAPSESPVSPGSATAALPSCDDVTAALVGLVDDLAYDEAVSATNTAPEDYDQRVCVYVSADAATQFGVTIAAIPFQQGELDAYATLPNAIADARLEDSGAVLQTFAAGDADDGHLDSSLYLFDTKYSVTIQGITEGGTTAATLPQLTVDAAIDAAFAVRELIS